MTKRDHIICILLTFTILISLGIFISFRIQEFFNGGGL
jgi:hypothetical protein